jgi:hypothetical protein
MAARSPLRDKKGRTIVSMRLEQNHNDCVQRSGSGRGGSIRNGRVPDCNSALRATLASVLMILMLAVSSVGSACALSCDFRTHTASCHEPARPQIAAMPGMTDCPQVSSLAAASPIPSFGHLVTPCHHEVCQEQSVTKDDLSLSTRAATGRYLAAPTIIVLLPLLQSADRPCVSPPTQPCSVVSLRTILRV